MLNWKKENDKYYLCLGNEKTSGYVWEMENHCYMAFVNHKRIGLWFNTLKGAKLAVTNNLQ